MSRATGNWRFVVSLALRHSVQAVQDFIYGGSETSSSIFSTAVVESGFDLSNLCVAFVTVLVVLTAVFQMRNIGLVFVTLPLKSHTYKSYIVFVRCCTVYSLRRCTDSHDSTTVRYSAVIILSKTAALECRSQSRYQVHRNTCRFTDVDTEVRSYLPQPTKLRRYCDTRRLSVCLSVCPSVCLFVY